MTFRRIHGKIGKSTQNSVDIDSTNSNEVLKVDSPEDCLLKCIENKKICDFSSYAITFGTCYFYKKNAQFKFQRDRNYITYRQVENIGGKLIFQIITNCFHELLL